MADEGTGTVNLTSPLRHRPAPPPRRGRALAIVVLALSLIFGLIAMHALTQEGASADVSSPTGSVETAQAFNDGSVLAVAACSICDHDGALGSLDLWMAVFACAMLVFVAIWRARDRTPLIGLRLPPRAVLDVSLLRRPPRPMSLDLLSLCVLRT
jgi:hypothetical protein